MNVKSPSDIHFTLKADDGLEDGSRDAVPMIEPDDFDVWGKYQIGQISRDEARQKIPTLMAWWERNTMRATLQMQRSLILVADALTAAGHDPADWRILDIEHESIEADALFDEQSDAILRDETASEAETTQRLERIDALAMAEACRQVTAVFTGYGHTASQFLNLDAITPIEEGNVMLMHRDVEVTARLLDRVFRPVVEDAR